MYPFLFAAADGSEPAKGAAIGEVIGATTGAMVVTAILLGLGLFRGLAQTTRAFVQRSQCLMRVGRLRKLLIVP